jgi:large subunit ribosomal protein L10
LPLQRGQKETVVHDVTELLKGAQAVLLADYRGLTVAQLGKLRQRMRDGNAEFHIVKNTLARRAFEAAGLTVPTDLLRGPTALAVLRDDLSGPVKAINQVADETELLTVKGGIMGARLLDAETAKALAKLPTRAELLSQFLGVLQAPQRQLVTVLNAPLVNFVGVLKAYSEKEEAAA